MYNSTFTNTYTETNVVYRVLAGQCRYHVDGQFKLEYMPAEKLLSDVQQASRSELRNCCFSLRVEG